MAAHDMSTVYTIVIIWRIEKKKLPCRSVSSVGLTFLHHHYEMFLALLPTPSWFARFAMVPELLYKVYLHPRGLLDV